jgi:4-hydroxy-2-oxoheptanedioate aldolase
VRFLASATISSATAPPLGTWLKLATAETVEIMAYAGFEFVVVDMEHTTIDIETVATCIKLAGLHGMTAIVRVPDSTPALIQRLLDAGAAGILMPHVESAEDVAAFVSSARFPPHGTRGAGTISRAGKWGMLPRAEYLRHGNEDVVLIAALESRDAMDAIDSILSVDGLTAVFVGAGDLSLSMGCPADDPQVQSLIDDVLAACTKAGTPCGAVMSNAAQAAREAERGWGFLTLSNDASLILRSAQTLVEDVRSLYTSARAD